MDTLTFLKEQMENFIDLLYPRSCIHCADGVAGRQPFAFLCERCARQLTYARSPACPSCGYPFFGAIEEDRICPHCRELNPHFHEGRTAVLFKGPATELIHGIKYHGKTYLMRDVGKIFARSTELLEFLSGAILVPVPLHARKERERGFNQSRLLAESLASLARNACVMEVLRRTIDTKSQTRFDRASRQKNLKNAFAIKEKFSLDKNSKELRYVLVDDVFTTGSTLNACALALRTVGLEQIDAVSFGHG